MFEPPNSPFFSAKSSSLSALYFAKAMSFSGLALKSASGTGKTVIATVESFSQPSGEITLNNLENGVGNSEEEVEEGPIIEEGELKTEKEEVDEEEEEELKEQKLNNKPEVKKIAKTDKGIAKK